MEQKIIAIDLGDVAIDWSPEKFFRGVGEHFGIESEDFRLHWQGGGEYTYLASLRARADMGLSSREIHRELAQKFGHTDFNEFVRVFTEHADIQIAQGFLEFRDELAKTNAELIVLSNMCEIHRDYVIQEFSHVFDPHIPRDRRFFSCDIGAVKHPDPQHFHTIAERIKRDMRQMILIDDRAENIQGIVAAGGDGIVHTGNFEKTREELRKRKIL